MRAGAFVVDNLFRVVARAGRLHPRARPARHRVRVHRDVPYADDGMREHHLDVYEPLEKAPPWPVLLYVHGGGFRILSKDTHWMMALAFARRGFLVFNIDYRLAPKHRYPAAITDAAAAYCWVVDNAARYGGDLSRLVLAGESAGANLVTALTLAACYERPEPFAQKVFATGVVPRAVVPACGIFQVSDVESRFARRPLPMWLRDRIVEVHDAYLGGIAPEHDQHFDLCDPVVALERGDKPARPLPPFFLPVGTKDPLLDDTRRMAAALERLEAPVEARYYPGEVHAFHAMLFRANARRCWRDTYDFLDRHLS
jgi:acetyl esterase